MGGVEDSEPLSKRLKVSPAELGSPQKLSLVSKLVNCFMDSMVGPLPSHGKEDIVGLKGIIKRSEFVRIITQALYSLGYEKTGALLEEESGIELHSPVIELFKKQLLDGRWEESLRTFHKIGLMDEKILKSATFMILEQKFFELIASNRVMDALKSLRNEITPLCINKKRVHELSGCIVSPSQCNLLGFDQAIDSMNSRMKLLEELQKLLPPSVMVPNRRLEYLVEQALEVQREACIYHNPLDSSLSLYSDHQCGRSQIPSSTIQVLHAHKNDVWHVQFSNSGKYLASASKDHSAIIWEVLGNREWTLKHTLKGHTVPVHMVSWSPDDRMLLTCAIEDFVRCWDVCSGDCIRVFQKDTHCMVSCGWFPDGNRVITGLADSRMITWDLQGKELESWQNHKAIVNSDVAFTADSKWIISICTENIILLLNKETKFERLLEEEHAITSFSLSKNCHFLLVNLINQEIHLWSIVDDLKLIAKYKGHKRSRFVIRSCFGGLEQAFIASGSEDSQVYIWLKSTGELIEALPGHSGSVNSVSWNPADHHMLASGSDDCTIRIWGLHEDKSKHKSGLSNGIIHCNGNCK